MTRVTRIEDLIDELDQLRAYGVPVSEATYDHARQVDIRLLSLLDRRQAQNLLAALPTGFWRIT